MGFLDKLKSKKEQNDNTQSASKATAEKKPKEAKPSRAAKREQKKNFENLMSNDYLVEAYLTHKRKKVPNPIFAFDLLDEADMARLDERIKAYKKQKGEKEKAKADEEEKKRKAQEKTEEEKRQAEARGEIYCDYFMMSKIMNNRSDVCPVCNSRMQSEDKYVAKVSALFSELVGYTAGITEAKPQYIYKTQEKIFPAKAYRCPKCEYTVMSATYTYFEKYVIDTADYTDEDSEEYKRTKQKDIVKLYGYRPKTKKIKGFKAGRLYNSDIYRLAEVALSSTLREDCREWMARDAFYEKKETSRPVQTGNVGFVSMADEIAKFYDLKEKGIISEEEFQAKKKELLSK